MMKRDLSPAIYFPETYWLIAGAILGYVCFVMMLGTSGLVISVGGAIAYLLFQPISILN
jgi:hypothetical protein